MAERMTTSAHSHSASVTERTLRSTSLNSHSCGNNAATVISPKGGNMALRFSNSKASSNDQKLLGNRGYRSKTRIRCQPLFIEHTQVQATVCTAQPLF